MTIGTFILKNALRNKRRATLSILSVAVSLFLLVTLLVALRELTLPPEGAGAELRVVVRNKISIANPLPARQRPIIEKIPGVEAVSPFTWFGGQIQERGGDDLRAVRDGSEGASARCSCECEDADAAGCRHFKANGRPASSAKSRRTNTN